MRQDTALRILYAFTLLPSALASVICYDLQQPMHPEIIVPVDCWSTFAPASRSRDKKGAGAHDDKDWDGDGPYGDAKHGNDYDGDDEIVSAHASTTTDDNVSNLPFFEFAPDSDLGNLWEPALPPPSWDQENKFQFNVDCKKAPYNICTGVSNTLGIAGWYVSQVWASYIRC